MIRFQGTGASRGIAIGPAYLMDMRLVIAERRILRNDREAEVARLDAALAAAEEQLDLVQRKVDEAQGSGHEFIEAHRLILRSPELAGEARRLINGECFSAEWAVSRASERIRLTFSRLDDRYFRDRGGDFDVVAERLLRVLLGLPELRPGVGAPRGGVAVGTDISPLDPHQLQRAGILAIVSESGGATSLAAVRARACGLPYVFGIRSLAAQVTPAGTLIVDGTHGEVIVDPDEACLHTYRLRAETEKTRLLARGARRALQSVTSDGVAIHLAANVESLAGVAAALAAGAESIGLFRTEFLYLERPDLPGEEEQYQDALAAMAAAPGMPMTFRTIDLGGDKLPLAFRILTGPNPALGVRSIRFSLQRPEILRPQLRALYRAAAQGPLRLMFPLVSGLFDLRQLRAVCDDVRGELGRAGEVHDATAALGVLIETPSAALTADHLARQCDFLSIGTNDLIQYAFAADRENEDVAYLYQPLHPAVLRMLKLVVDAARTARVSLSICGDMAGDPSLTWILIGLGLRELSMDPDRIPLVKAVVRGSSLAEAEEVTAQALALDSEVEIADLLRVRLGDRFAEEIDGSFLRTRRA
ncbi:MAG TPA: phosphoenolpyruvate--protein phosphotransferase [Polyangia bacterium]|jgi:phosphotransferase system enzyme I (PtsI)|nr:phosphoenolpyruvate--protein phosphotransferase [Polyangia bacterium]